MKKRARVLLLLSGIFLLFCGGCLMFSMPGQSYQGKLPPLSKKELECANQLEKWVRKLAGEIGERNLFRPEKLKQALEFLEKEFKRMGYTPKRHGFSLSFQGKQEKVFNLIAELPGKTKEIVLLGAHYDTAPGTPGANDNASGVALLLRLAQEMKGKKFNKTVQFVAFVNEEPPFFWTEQMGSFALAREYSKKGKKITAMISLETLGYYSDKEGSQCYPLGFLKWFYPTKGNFLGFVSDLRGMFLLRRVIYSFRKHAKLPSEGAALPGFIPGVSWSDHWSFSHHGYPAVMITDTAPFRYPHYHDASDTPDKLDYARMARIATGLAQVVKDLCNK